jgi:hypothetical protein
MMIEKLNLEFPTRVDNCQEKKRFFSSGMVKDFFSTPRISLGKCFFPGAVVESVGDYEYPS